MIALLALLGLALLLLLALALGGPRVPPASANIVEPFKSVDLSDLPPTELYIARDGATLAFRAYLGAGDPRGSVVLVHGSSAGGRSMHLMAKGLAAAGYSTYALDMRGHGDSGPKGRIAYVGQLEDDLEDFVQGKRPAAPATLAGFSSGGGFVLRVAGSARHKLFANYLFLSPFLGQDAPTYRSGGGGWVSVGIPRLIAIGLLGSAGVHVLDQLPVLRFALDETSKALLTPQYSYALAQNFRPQRDYRANIRAIERPARLVAGTDDELFYADRFAEVFRAQGKDVPVTLVPGTGHIALTLDAAAIRAAVDAVTAMDAAHP